MSEWSNEPVLKTGEPQGSGGSNPSPSANFPMPRLRQSGVGKMMSSSVMNRPSGPAEYTCKYSRIPGTTPGCTARHRARIPYFIRRPHGSSSAGTAFVISVHCLSQPPEARPTLGNGARGWLARSHRHARTYCDQQASVAWARGLALQARTTSRHTALTTMTHPPLSGACPPQPPRHRDLRSVPGVVAEDRCEIFGDRHSVLDRRCQVFVFQRCDQLPVARRAPFFSCSIDSAKRGARFSLRLERSRALFASMP